MYRIEDLSSPNRAKGYNVTIDEERTKGIGAIAALGFKVKKTKAVDAYDSYDYIEHTDGTRIRVNHQGYQNTYHFSFEGGALGVIPWRTREKLMSTTPQPNKVHKPSVRTVQAWLDYCAAERGILQSYFEIRTAERDREMSAALALGAVDIGYHSKGQKFSAESPNKLFRLEWDFSDFTYTSVKLTEHFYQSDAATIYKALGAVPVEGLEG
jgi:hypothetical protein